MIDKEIIISTSQCSQVIEYLKNYKDENISFKYIENTSPLNCVFSVSTNESINEKLIRKVKDIIKASSFGGALFFMVTVK